MKRDRRVRVRIAPEGWRVWSSSGREATITQDGPRFTLRSYPAGCPIATSRYWHRVAQFARERYR